VKADSAENGNCSESTLEHNSNQEKVVPPRKKPSNAEETATSGRGRARAANAETNVSPRRRPESTAPGSPGRGQNLVIVESPAKARTINKYLGSNFKVLASYGHVRDLPKRRQRGEAVAGVDIEAGWKPTYVVVENEDGGRRRRSARDILAELKREAGKANQVYLATDPDREGEAIAWHIEDELHLDQSRTFRIAFNEITRNAVQSALSHPGHIDEHRVRAQEARRILDRVVGFPLSKLLSNKVRRGLSAGRVQSVALRLVVEREREIENFKSEEFWKITAHLAPAGSVTLAPTPLAVVLSKRQDSGEETDEGTQKKPKKTELPESTFLAELAEWAGSKFQAANQNAALTVAQQLDAAHYRVTRVEQKDRPERAQPPFTTSTLQQQASSRLHFTTTRTMQVAQRLYEGVTLQGEGQVALITYMRTDSTRVSDDALRAVRGYIDTTYGPNYLPARPNVYASGKSAQEAHEAIRPTDLKYTPDHVARLGLGGQELRLYTLIFQRFVASQMNPAIFAITNVEVLATPPNRAQEKDVGLFKAQGKILKFDGYRRVLSPHRGNEDAILPPLAPEQDLDRLGLTASQHFTQPPPRYNEASLVRALEKEGIGRPSTYAPIIQKITSDARGYIEVRDRKFFATQLGKDVTDLLVAHFPRVMDLKFTNQMEGELDQIASGQMVYRVVLDQFWGPFSEALQKAEAQMPSQRAQEIGEDCPKCGRPLVRNYSPKTRRYFVGCSGFKEGCKYIKPEEGEEQRPEPVLTEHKCPSCGKPMLQRMGKSGPFLGCSGYPDCQTTMNLVNGQPVPSARPTEHKCDKCGKVMVLREGRRGPFLACTGYPKCKNAKDVDAQGNPVQPLDLGIRCSKCDSPMIVRKSHRGPFLGCSAYPKCKSTKKIPEEFRERVEAMYPPPEKKETPEIEVQETCPDCGGKMKLRRGRRGARWFLGCANYPKCKGTREAPEELLEHLADAGVPS
jgi:DNA topoisomerase-1